MGQPNNTRPRRAVPVLGNDIVTRDRLIRLLQKERPVTLVVAPAGSGKTTLVADWLRRTQRNAAWLTLQVLHNSVPAFLAAVVDVVQQVYPGACHETQALLSTAPQVPLPVLAHQFCDDLAEVNNPAEMGRSFVLVLDDYHAVREIEVQRLIINVVEEAPSNVQLVLITRLDPPLPLPALRARNSLTEIRVEELRFSVGEAREFLDLTLEGTVDDELVADLDGFVEGWAAGLRMASLLMQRDRHAAVPRADVHLSSRLILEYLASEIVDRLPPWHQHFLERSAILERVCAELCAALVDDSSVEQCRRVLQQMARDGMFVVAVDDEAKWYRFHPLLRVFMSRRAADTLQPDGLCALHLRASTWLANDGQVEMALSHAVQAKSGARVAELIYDHRHAVLSRGDWATVALWKQIIPQEMLLQHPQLLVLCAWEANRRGDAEAVLSQVETIEALLGKAALDESEGRLLRSELDAFLSQGFFWQGRFNESLDAGLRSLAAAPPNYERTRGMAALYAAGSLQYLGREGEADALLQTCLELCKHHRLAADRFFILTASGFIQLIRADMHKLEAVARRILALTPERDNAEAYTTGSYLLGCAHYGRNDLEGARAAFGVVVERPYLTLTNVHFQAVIGLAATLLALGFPEDARSIVEQGIEHHKSRAGARQNGTLLAYLSKLNLREGRTAQVVHWLSRAETVPVQIPLPDLVVYHLCRAEVLLGLGTPEALADAVELLAAIAKNERAVSSRRVRIGLLALQAVCDSRLHDDVAALDRLEQAIDLADAGGSVRFLADLDSLIGALLDQLAAAGRCRTSVIRIRRAALAFAPSVPPILHSAQEAMIEQPQIPPSARRLTLEEALTPRELDVLRLLLNDRPTNKEIARELVVSVETIKRHMNNIFQKLHVENRRQAIVEARRLGILPPS
jgi:LuxR family maltose regulon positive regulatory protein